MAMSTITVMDKAVRTVYAARNEVGHILLIIADHGNAKEDGES